MAKKPDDRGLASPGIYMIIAVLLASIGTYATLAPGNPKWVLPIVAVMSFILAIRAARDAGWVAFNWKETIPTHARPIYDIAAYVFLGVGASTAIAMLAALLLAQWRLLFAALGWLIVSLLLALAMKEASGMDSGSPDPKTLTK